MRIAVIDDDKWLHNTLKQYFLQFQIANDDDLSVDYYTSCEEIHRRMLDGTDYDLLFLDIEFSQEADAPQMRGTDFGRLIRRRMLDYDTRIVFISAEASYAMELFPVRPAGFLVKPIGYAAFADCLKNILDEYAKTNEFLDFTLENTRHRIRIKEILYLKAHGKKVEFHTRTGSFSVYGKIQDLIAGCEKQFLCTSRGEYVNLQHVMLAAPKEIRLTDDQVLHISRGRMNAVRDRLSEL